MTRTYKTCLRTVRDPLHVDVLGIGQRFRLAFCHSAFLPTCFPALQKDSELLVKRSVDPDPKDCPDAAPQAGETYSQDPCATPEGYRQQYMMKIRVTDNVWWGASSLAHDEKRICLHQPGGPNVKPIKPACPACTANLLPTPCSSALATKSLISMLLTKQL